MTQGTPRSVAGESRALSFAPTTYVMLLEALATADLPARATLLDSAMSQDECFALWAETAHGSLRDQGDTEARSTWCAARLEELLASSQHFVESLAAKGHDKNSQSLAGAVCLMARRLCDLQADFDRRLEEEKLASLAEFAAGAGHEINNPLAVISGRAQLFLREELDPQRRYELAVIHTQARRVHEMIADLMLFARPPQPQCETCAPRTVLENVVAELMPRAAERSITFTCKFDELLPTVQADVTQLSVAVRAVCKNALEAVADRGHVELHATTKPETDGECLAITVQDNGPGLTEEQRRHAFDPFYSGRAAGRGLGLGLSKCWRIVTAHGGRVILESKAGRGTTVTLSLPIKSDLAAQATSE